MNAADATVTKGQVFPRWIWTLTPNDTTWLHSESGGTLYSTAVRCTSDGHCVATVHAHVHADASEVVASMRLLSGTLGRADSRDVRSYPASSEDGREPRLDHEWCIDPPGQAGGWSGCRAASCCHRDRMAGSQRGHLEQLNPTRIVLRFNSLAAGRSLSVTNDFSGSSMAPSQTWHRIGVDVSGWLRTQHGRTGQTHASMLPLTARAGEPSG